MSDNTKDSFGSTLAFPLQAEGGTLKTVSGIEALEQNIKALVLTKKGDHVLRPDLGWDMRELIATGDSDQISQAIRQAIIDGENRINHSDLEVIVERPQDGLMGVAVIYSIKNEDKRRTLKVDVPLDL
jgi:phage baseplate assembly protein W